MRYRTAFIVTITVVIFMFVLEWSVMAAVERAMATGWELPLWFRILFGIGMFWRGFWPFVTFLLLVVLIGIASLTSALRRSRASQIRGVSLDSKAHR